MGVDSRNHLFVFGLPPGWIVLILLLSFFLLQEMKEKRGRTMTGLCFLLIVLFLRAKALFFFLLFVFFSSPS